MEKGKGMKLHVVSFQVPYPPAYGGLIDVYYKLKALHRAGCRVTLHTYLYGEAGKEDDALGQVAERVYYYRRRTGVRKACTLLPYIVASRCDPALLENLCQDDAPILFEGLHTCYFLSHPRLAGRELWVRTHNVEHDYYKGLAKSAAWGLSKLYYGLEAIRLRHYEDVLCHATRIYAISPADAAHFTKAYPHAKIFCLPCFYDDSSEGDGEDGILANPALPWDGQYVLYHGNLAVEENTRAVCHIVRCVLPLAQGVKLVVAGGHPPEALRKEWEKGGNVRVMVNPSKQEIDSLIAHARANILLTFQPTGVKLKLLHALSKGCGECVVNSAMLPDERFGSICIVADAEQALADALVRCWNAPVSASLREKHRCRLRELGYGNDVGCLLD